MTGFLRLFHRYILRDLARNPIRTLLTLTGVALGIVVVVAVQVANDRAISSFNNSLRILSGQADLQISANGLKLDEDLIGELSWVWDVGAITAIVEGQVDLDASPNPTERKSFRIFGVDLLSDAPFRTYTLAEGDELGLDITREQFVDLLIEPDNIIIPSLLAEELNLSVGDTLQFLVSSHWQNFRVGAILQNEGVAEAFGGRVLFMDIAGAQTALNKVGWVDRIEVLLNDLTLLDAVEKRIRSQLPPSVIVYRPEEATAYNEKIVRAFRYNLTALSYIALVVGMILVYNTLNIAVVRRQGEISALRALGTSRRTIKWMFLIEATGFGVIGAALGIWAGELLAVAAGALVSQTISGMYTGVSIIPSLTRSNPMFYIEMLLLGGVLAAISGTGPALRATEVSPAGALCPNLMRSIPATRVRMHVLGGIAAMLLGTVLSFGPPIEGFPFLGYASGVSFIAGFGLLSPLLTRILLKVIRQLVTRALPAEGRLAVQTIEGSLGRIVVAVMSLAIAVAMLISVAIMVSSFRDTVIVWVDQTLKGDLYLRPAAFGNNEGWNVLQGETLQVLETMPAIEAIDRFRSMTIDYEGFPAFLAAGEFATVASHSNLLFMNDRRTPEVAQRLIDGNRVVVSEPFSVRHGIESGDRIILPTPTGMEPFDVEAVFYDYSSEGGLILMDRGTYLGKFEDPDISNVALYLKPDADPMVIRTEIAAAIPDAQLRIATNGELRGQVLRVFDQTFQITYALEVIAMVIAVLGISNTLAALVLERRPEIAMLRFIGASRRQIRRIIVLESGLIGLIGGLIGLVLGILLSLLLIYVINFQSFGWTIQFTIPLAFLLQSLFLVLLATVVAGVYPASLALKMDPIKGIRAE